MKNIFMIFKHDLKELTSKKATLFIIIGLILLPTIYAWPNIISSWDPYANTDQIKVAVTNLDEGTIIDGKTINIGNSLIEHLHTNHALNWQFITNKDQAETGVKSGEYYASIIIPNNFTQNMTSITSGTLKKAKIEYSVNEKINAISPKITNSGTNAIATNIQKNFVESANRIIFKKLHEIGIELEQDLSTIHTLQQKINFLNEHFDDYQNELATLLPKIALGKQYINEIQQTLPHLNTISEQATQIGTQSKDIVATIDNFNQQLVPNLDKQFTKAETALNKIATALTDFNFNQLSEKEKNTINTITYHITNVKLAFTVIEEMIDTLNDLSPNNEFATQKQKLNQLQEDITTLQNHLTKITQNIEEHQTNKTNLKALILNDITTIYSKTNTLHQNVTNELAPKIHTILNNIQTKINTGTDLIQSLQQKLPQANTKLTNTDTKITMIYDKLTKLNTEMPTLKTKLQKIVDKINLVENKITNETIQTLLNTDYKKQAEFFANPLEIENKRLYPIANYGSALTPFYTVLAIWVGSVLISSLLTTKVEDTKNQYKPYEKYLGRSLLFVSIATLQTFIIALGNIYLLKTQAVHPYRFILYAVFIAIIFSTIIYTIVYILGNIGKALCIIALVLQMGASGGTFPIQMTPKFFQALHAKIPFSYAISLLREAVGGIYLPAVQMEITFLITTYIITIITGLIAVSILARFINPNKKTSKSKLFL